MIFPRRLALAFSSALLLAAAEHQSGRIAPPLSGCAPGAAASGSASFRSLPLIEVSSGKDGEDRLAILLSGDGGWADIDREISRGLAERGLAVVGWNSLAYFWKRRAPEAAADDLGRVAEHYSGKWRKKRLVLIGYSLGADVLPAMASRLPRRLLDRLALLALIGPGPNYDLEFHLSEWNPWSHARGSPVLPELRKLAGKPILCFQGKDERESLCPRLPADLAMTFLLPGDHHFGGDYRPILENIVRKSGP